MDQQPLVGTAPRPDPKAAWLARRAASEFIGVDGEGETRQGKHYYVLLGVGRQQIEDRKGLDWKDCFGFLYGQNVSAPTATFTGFYLGYDFTRILCTLPEERARRLLTPAGISSRKRRQSGGNSRPFPVRYDGWEFDFLPARRLQLRPAACDCAERGTPCEHPQNPWMYICDSGPFWQTSFLNVIRPASWQQPICTDAEYEEVRKGKERRASARLDDEMRYYNQLENVLLARAMTALRDGFGRIGVNLSKSQWYGPGQAAAAWMRKEKVPTREDIQEAVPDYFSEAARQSYFGGWFEIPAHGIIPGSTWEYDINSAYPWIIAGLPCLRHGRYSRGTASPPELGCCFARVRLRGYSPYLGSGFNRSKEGDIRRPSVTEGWYLWSEVQAGIRAGLVSDAEVREWVAYEPCDCPPPCANVAGLYEERLRIGKDTVAGKAAKLAYNSMYGKFAQSVGAAPYGNWAYAAMITAGCRTAILNAIATHPKGSRAVVMIATDGIYFTSPHPGLPVSNRLGDWECKEKQNLTLFKPGVYWDDKARVAILDGKFTGFKARGVNARYFAQAVGEADRLFLLASGGPDRIPEFRYRLWESEHPVYLEKKWPGVTFEIGFSMTSALTALAHGKWEDAGKVTQSVEVEHDSNPSAKRGTSYWDSSSRFIRTTVIDLESRGESTQSVPYEKRFGTDDPFSPENDEILGVHPEGTIRFLTRTLARQLSGEETP